MNILGSRLGEPFELRFDVPGRLFGFASNELLVAVALPLFVELVKRTLVDVDGVVTLALDG